MRVNLPLNGLIKAKGDVLIHIAMLIASFFVYSSTYNMGANGGDGTEKSPDATQSFETTLDLLYYVRLMHGLMVGSHILRITTESDANDLLHMLLKAVEIWGYLITMIYLQYYLMSQSK